MFKLFLLQSLYFDPDELSHVITLYVFKHLFKFILPYTPTFLNGVSPSCFPTKYLYMHAYVLLSSAVRDIHACPTEPILLQFLHEFLLECISYTVTAAAFS
jgi:hypothetical protein